MCLRQFGDRVFPFFKCPGRGVMRCCHFCGKNDSAINADTLARQREDFFAIYGMPASTRNNGNSVSILPGVEILGEECAIGSVAIFRPRVASVAQSADNSPCKTLSKTAYSCSRLSPSFQNNSHAQLSLLGSLTRPTFSNGAESQMIFVRSFLPDPVIIFTDRPFSGSIVKGSPRSASALRFTLSKISLASTKLSGICDPR